MPISARSASSRLVSTVTPSSIGGLSTAAAAATAASSIALPPAACTVSIATPSFATCRTAPATVFGNVVQLEVEKDRQSDPGHRLDPARPLRGEELEAELHAADVGRQRPCEGQGALEIGAVDGAEDRIGQGGNQAGGSRIGRGLYQRRGSVQNPPLPSRADHA